MKLRIALAMATTVFTCPIAFWLYGGARTMCETVGFSTRALIIGLLFGAVFPAVTASFVLFVVRSFWPRLRSTSLLSITLGIGIGVVIGSILSECWILVDESKFASEVREVAPGLPYARPRAWPNQIGSLVYVPGKGVHATD